jgi:hypothetical protein
MPLKDEMIINRFKMKKVFLAIAFFAIVISFSSCKTHEHCPAYGNASVHTSDSGSRS